MENKPQEIMNLDGKIRSFSFNKPALKTDKSTVPEIDPDYVKKYSPYKVGDTVICLQAKHSASPIQTLFEIIDISVRLDLNLKPIWSFHCKKAKHGLKGRYLYAGGATFRFGDIVRKLSPEQVESLNLRM